MDLRQLQYFIAVAEALNFRKAAQRLHVTQSSVSRRVQELERELGAVLLHRDRQHVQLTENGRSVLSQAQLVMADAAALLAVVDRTDQRKITTLKVGVGLPLAKSIQPLVIEYARQFPNVDVQYQDIVVAAMQNKALRKKEIDVAIFWPPFDPLYIDSELLFKQQFRVILPKTNPLAKRKKLLFKQLADQVLLLAEQAYASNRKVLQLARDTGVTLKIVHTTALPHEAGANLVLTGKGIYVLAGSPLRSPSFGSNIATVPLDEPVSIDVHAAWRKGEKSAEVLGFVNTARRFFQGASADRPSRSS